MRTRPLPPLEELRAALDELAVPGIPREGDERALRGLLDMALFLAEHRKRVTFEGFSWEDPAFVAQDAKLAMRVAYLRLEEGAPLEDALRAALPRVAEGNALLALDLHGTSLREFDLMHLLYGEVTLYSWPHKPPQPADRRIDEAREAGWVKTLKEHNLLPGRGIVVLDEHQGLLLRDPAFAGLLGLLVLYPNGHVQLAWNPFVPPARASSDLQYWLAWAEGTGGASEWRQMLHVEEGD